MFPDFVMPLTFVLPLMLGVWTRRHLHVWMMAAAFSLKTLLKAWWILPEMTLTGWEEAAFLGSTWFNIIVGAMVVSAIIALRNRLEGYNATVTAQNHELEAQAEELSQQNEEIKAQSEELAEQNEEIEAQNEEVTRQNEDLVDLNTRLSGREEILQGLMDSFRKSDSVPQMLEDLCARTLVSLGPPAVSIALLEQKENGFVLRAQSSHDEMDTLPEVWPATSSIASVVLKERKTAYVSDLSRRPELADPFGPDHVIRSVLATPLLAAGGVSGMLVACSRESSHWTEEQFRVIEWVAAQGRLMMDTLASQTALMDHAAALEAANQAKDRFLAMLSHELRTPLTPVLAAAGVLEGDPRLPEDVREDLGMIRRNAGVQSKLIDDLLDLTRISRGKIELDQEALSVGNLLRDSISIVAGDIDAKAQELRIDAEALQACAIIGDGSRLQQVFWNLLKNAAKFSPPGAIIHVTGRCQKDHALIEVTDNGLGIAPEDLERIFLPFEQSHHANRGENEGGLGLGLAIAKAIVELHCGSIEARSSGAEKGSTFSVKLPLADVPAPGDSRMRKPLEPVATTASKDAPARILLVEDHGDTGKIIQRILRNSGYQVDHARTAAEAWNYFEAGSYDLIVSDVGLPDENGIELMRRMCGLRPETRGICLSGYGRDEDIAACREAGFQEHLTKPIDFNRLQTVVSKVLARGAEKLRES